MVWEVWGVVRERMRTIIVQYIKCCAAIIDFHKLYIISFPKMYDSIFWYRPTPKWASGSRTTRVLTPKHVAFIQGHRQDAFAIEVFISMGTAFEFSMGTVFSFYEDYVYATHNMPSRENGKFDDANSIPSRKCLTIIENVYATGPCRVCRAISRKLAGRKGRKRLGRQWDWGIIGSPDITISCSAYQQL